MVVRKTGAAVDSDPITSEAPSSPAEPGARSAADGSMLARPGRRKPAKDTNSTPTVTDANRERLRSVCVATSATSPVARAAVHSTDPAPSASGSLADANCPARVRSKVSMQLFTKIETAETNLAVDSHPRLWAANCLKDDGASTPVISFCSIATSARSRPEMRLTAYRPRNSPAEGIMPGPAATEGRTIMLAPTVLPVMRRAAEATSAYPATRPRDPSEVPSRASEATAARVVLDFDGVEGAVSEFLEDLDSSPKMDEARARLLFLRPGSSFASRSRRQ
mmetsp:Transcript_2952/g.6365  ORF Transcript_2952/g.6365 Transcript_2952/m.6365 type:complete len:279 (-) Transcript_2952:249-1085(-)